MAYGITYTDHQLIATLPAAANSRVLKVHPAETST